MSEEIDRVKFEGPGEHLTRGHHLEGGQKNAAHSVKESQGRVTHISKTGHSYSNNNGQDRQLPSGTDILSETETHGDGNSWDQRSHDLIKIHRDVLERDVTNGNVERKDNGEHENESTTLGVKLGSRDLSQELVDAFHFRLIHESENELTSGCVAEHMNSAQKVRVPKVYTGEGCFVEQSHSHIIEGPYQKPDTVV